jgi:tRNA(fMet)-specific endonuclease VapC
LHMGLILDSSVIIAAERMSHGVERLLQQVISIAGDQDAALSAVGLTELVHGLYRTSDPDIRARRELFLNELLRAVTVYPYTKATAMLAGRIDGEQRARGITIPSLDLMIGATALNLDFSLMTVNVRHFQMLPGLRVLTF